MFYKEARTKTWKDYTRQEQAELIMKYVDDIELALVGNEVVVNQINFRESICKPCQELYDKGYIDTAKPSIFGNVLGNIRFNNYLPKKEVGEIIMRLRQYYDVARVFPLKYYYKLDQDRKMKIYEFEIIYICEEDKFQPQEIDTVFNYIQDEVNTSIIYTKDSTPISRRCFYWSKNWYILFT